MFIIHHYISLGRLGDLLLLYNRGLIHGQEPVDALPETGARECRALLYYDLSALGPELLYLKVAAQFLA